MDTFPRAELVPLPIDLPPDNVFVTLPSIVGNNSYLVENPKGIQTFIEKELHNASVKLSKSEEQAKMRFDCKIIIYPVHKSIVPADLLKANTEYSSIVMEIQIIQKHDHRLREPYYDWSGICIETNENVIEGIKSCLRNLLKKLSNKEL